MVHLVVRLVVKLSMAEQKLDICINLPTQKILAQQPSVWVPPEHANSLDFDAGSIIAVFETYAPKNNLGLVIMFLGAGRANPTVRNVPAVCVFDAQSGELAGGARIAQSLHECGKR